MPLYDDNASDGLQEIKELLKELVESNKQIIQLLLAGRVLNAQPIPAFTWNPLQPTPPFHPYLVPPSPATAQPFYGDPQGGHNFSHFQGGQTEAGQ